MTPEEKAKAYDEALEKSKRLYEQGTITESLAYIFPELKESEDERIRKELIENFKWYCGDFPEITKWGKDDNLLVKDIIAWLEKQGEQNLANSARTCKDEQKPIKWDEYDEMYVAALITMVKNHCTTDDKLKNELIGWLVSLKTSIK